MRIIIYFLLLQSIIIAQGKGSIIITEFFPEPCYQIDWKGEYIELYNNTDSVINMTGWRFIDTGYGYTGPLKPYGSYNLLIQPKSFFVFAVDSDPAGDSSIIPDYVYKQKTDTSFFALHNDDDEILLLNADLDTIAAVYYYNGNQWNIPPSSTIDTIGKAFELRDLTLALDGVTRQSSGDFVPAASRISIKNTDYGSPGRFGLVPTVPLLAYPSQKSYNLDTAITLKWYKSLNTNSYSVVVSDDSVFNQIVFEKNNISDTVVSLDNLNFGKIYYWKIKAKNSFTSSDYSSVRIFKTKKLEAQLYVKIYLEGVLNGNYLSTELNKNHLIPSHNRFLKMTNFINYNDSIESFNDDIVDWMVLELRKNIDSQSVALRKNVLLTKEGNLVDLHDSSGIHLDSLSGSYFITLYHRNHLPVMSSTKININNDSVFYDFTTSINKYYGNSAWNNSNKYGMYAGETNYDNQITSTDFNIYKKDAADLTKAYKLADWNLDGLVDIEDYNLFLNNFNKGTKSLVPN